MAISWLAAADTCVAFAASQQWSNQRQPRGSGPISIYQVAGNTLDNPRQRGQGKKRLGSLPLWIPEQGFLDPSYLPHVPVHGVYYSKIAGLEESPRIL